MWYHRPVKVSNGLWKDVKGSWFWPLGMSYPRMFLKLLWRTREIVRIRASVGILIRKFVNIKIPVLWDVMLCRHQCCLLF
jgi:hypothetical protein